MVYPLVILGGGLSGLAAAIRCARFGRKVLIIEKHRLAGGLNSYYWRQGRLLESGLHAMTNFAPPGERKSPLNILFRQLKLSRKSFVTHEQLCSEVIFPHRQSLLFSNDLELLRTEIATKFPRASDGFQKLLATILAYDPFLIRPWQSSRRYLLATLGDPLLSDMLLCPLMFYGNAEEGDMDFSQFVIMFRAIFIEGFFRPHRTIKEFLDLLLDHYRELGGEIILGHEVRGLETEGGRVTGVRLDDGQIIACAQAISTVGYPGTLRLLPNFRAEQAQPYEGRMSFTENIYLLPPSAQPPPAERRTVIFYNNSAQFDYRRPEEAVSTQSGVICYPDHFQGLAVGETFQVRITNPANYELWQEADRGGEKAPGKGRTARYRELKREWRAKSTAALAEIVGNYPRNIVYQDTFTPLTIEKYSGKAGGAVYGSPLKIKNGKTAYDNLFLAGTDQGYLGIVGSMLSGVVMVNEHVLGKESPDAT